MKVKKRTSHRETASKMDEDDGFTTSDAEVDSEVEDLDDAEKELGMWLGQLQEIQENEDGTKVAIRKPPNRLTLTPKIAMESFRNSILEIGGSQDIDLDAILGELCDLETQLTSTQTEINTSLQSTDYEEPQSPEFSTILRRPPPKNVNNNESKDAGQGESIKDVRSKAYTHSMTESAFDAIESQFMSALNELSEIGGANFEDLTTPVVEDKNIISPQETVLPPPTDTQNTSNITKLPPQVKPKPAGLTSPTPRGASTQHNEMQENTSNTVSPVGVTVVDYQHIAETTSSGGGSGEDTDSAFCDNVSLPSSGSHVSVNTASSHHSGSSLGSGTGSGSSGIPSSPTPQGQERVEFVRAHLEDFQQELEKENLAPAEQAAKLKAEKVRLALEKIKEANIKKLFVRAYTEDGSSKSILVDEKMSVAQVCDILMAKNHVQPSLKWAVVEQMPDLYMERMLEDHECLVDNLLLWTRDSNNKMMFAERPLKYDVFNNPEVYLITGNTEDKLQYEEAGRQALLQEFFSESTSHVPELEGALYLKSDGKKAWKRYYFVLRASGLYYNPKGKGKSSKDLVCLQQFDFVELYRGVGWKKKYKSPTEYCFALKHPQIQKKASKYIKYLCAEDQHTLNQWVVGIRIAKLGRQMLYNYQSAKQTIENWDANRVVPNKSLTGYLEQQKQVQQIVDQHQRNSVESMDENNRSSDEFPEYCVQVQSQHEEPCQSSVTVISHRESTLSNQSGIQCTQNISRQSTISNQSNTAISHSTSQQSVSSNGSHGRTPSVQYPGVQTQITTAQVHSQYQPVAQSIAEMTKKMSMEDKGTIKVAPQILRSRKQSETNDDFPPPPMATDVYRENLKNDTRSVQQDFNQSRVKQESKVVETHSNPDNDSNSRISSTSVHTVPQGGATQRQSSLSSSGVTTPVSPMPRFGSGRGKPPPTPPKRDDRTKLSFHGDSGANQGFLTDLQKVLVQKQSRGASYIDKTPQPCGPPLVSPKPKKAPQIAPKPKTPPKPNVVDQIDIDSLPPPPAELLQGLSPASSPSKKKPPPPPKRKPDMIIPKKN